MEFLNIGLYGTVVDDDGKKYTLLADANMNVTATNLYSYMAMAVNDDGNTYTIHWDLYDDLQEFNHDTCKWQWTKKGGKVLFEADYCNWNNFRIERV